PATVTDLNERLVRQLRDRDATWTHMAPPENLDWEEIEHFLIAPTGRSHKFDELDLDAYLRVDESKASNLTLDTLKRRRVQVKFSGSAEPVSRWSVYQCLVSEQRFDGGLYVLIEGRWF